MCAMKAGHNDGKAVDRECVVSGEGFLLKKYPLERNGDEDAEITAV